MWGLTVFSLTPSVGGGAGMILRVVGGCRRLKVAKVGADVQISPAFFRQKGNSYNNEI